jgi:hypothetical protein
MAVIDLTTPTRVFDVPTAVKRDGASYMGPDVRINAHSAADAITRVRAAGHTTNERNFYPTEVKKR